jgi:DedD protein
MAERRRGARGRSPLVRLVGLCLLAIPGFALGLLAGVAWEEPGLLVGHFFGRSEEVAWSEGPAEAPESTAEELPAVAAPGPPAGATRMRPEVLSPGPSAGRFAVQVGAFSESRAAERLAESLRGKGFEVYVSPGAKAGEARWRVRVGPLPSREEAERSATRLKVEEKLPTWVLDEDGAV